jgi:hypothetical protein
LSCFFNYWSVYGSRKPSLIRRFLSYGVKPNRSNVYKRTTFLISAIRFTYKFIIQDIKTKQNIFLIFLKYWPSSRDFNKLVIKAKMHANIYIFEVFFVVWKYNMIFFFFTFERLGRMHENEDMFLFYVLMKIGYFNTGFVKTRY